MDLASVVAALASVGVRVSGSTPNNNVQVDSSRACPTGLAGPEPSGTINDPGQHFQGPDTPRTAPAHAQRPRGRRAHPHGEKELHPPKEPPRTGLRSPPPHSHRQATTPTAARATTQATAQAPEEEEDTAATPETRGKNPQRTRDQGTGPQGGQPRGHPPDPPTRTAQPDSRSTEPTSHTTPNRAPHPPASHITSARVPHHERGQSNQRRPRPTLELQ